MDGNYKCFIEGGHAFETNEGGKLLVWEYEHHDGYTCLLCGEPLCIRCEEDWATQKCDKNATALPGLELDITPFNRPGF